ncbi:MAG TPA: hypothetical protein VGO47_05575 [Chlamydiales bacterium]|nr:hypothetical protein [Chlamydiales bacterium]
MKPENTALNFEGTPAVHRTPPASPASRRQTPTLMSGPSDLVPPASGPRTTSLSLSPDGRGPSYTLRPSRPDFVEKAKMVPPKQAKRKGRANPATLKKEATKNLLASTKRPEAANPRSVEVSRKLCFVLYYCAMRALLI